MNSFKTELMEICAANLEHVRFEQVQSTFPLDFLRTAFKAIAGKTPLSIRYHEFFSNEVEYTAYPYQVREYRERYYLICHIEGEARLYNFPFDRMVSIEVMEGIPFMEAQLSIDEHFGKVVGITVFEGGKQELITLSSSLLTAEYLRSKPLHASQKEISQDHACVLFTIEVIPNWELYAELLRFGPAVQVLEPIEVREKMMAQLDAALEAYHTNTPSTR